MTDPRQLRRLHPLKNITAPAFWLVCTEYRIQNTEYRIQNTECRAFPDIRSTLELTTARDKGGTADAVGLQAAQTYDHESGEPQERFRIEPSISGTHSGCAHRLDRATQSVTGDWRGEVIEANEDRPMSI